MLVDFEDDEEFNAATARPGNAQKKRQTRGKTPTRSPEEVKQRLERQRQKWDAHMTEVRSQIRSQTTKPYDPLEARRRVQEEKQAARRRAKEEREQFEREQERLREQRDMERKLKSKIPDNPRSTHASNLKVKCVRDRLQMDERRKAREEARQRQRKERLRKAGEELRPALDAFDRERGKLGTDEPGVSESEEEKPSLGKIVRENRRRLEERVKTSRPTLMDRLQVVSAREKAKAKVLRLFSNTMRDVYNDLDDVYKSSDDEEAKDDRGRRGRGRGKATHNDSWLNEALRDGVLNKGEIEYIRSSNPGIAMEEKDGEAGGELDNYELDFE